ncbi:dTMP kinase [Bradyrhizobium sp. HKCCYLRH1030]|uniref:dTMP kinase n=1 Tax=Bradyrhizobium sp. HKCCYLRH1030 TaxID=3420744 RepID=UPI003EBE77E0
MMTGIAISFEGGDGAGKSSVAKLVHDRLVGHHPPARFIYPKRPLFDQPYVQAHMAAIGAALWEQQGLSGPRNLLGDRHWVYLSAAWFEIIDQHLVRPALQRGELVLFDSWCQKLLARFQLKGDAIAEEATRAFAALTRPKFTVLLDVSPEIAARRKTTFGFAESGNFDGFSGATRENFIAYQSLVRSNLLAMAEAEDWSVIPVDGAEPRDLADLVIELLIRRGWIDTDSRSVAHNGTSGQAA